MTDVDEQLPEDCADGECDHPEHARDDRPDRDRGRRRPGRDRQIREPRRDR